MIFSSLQYLGFLTIVFLLYWKLSRKYQNILLLVASYYFYACWDWRFLGLIVVSTFVDYLSGLSIHRSENSLERKAWLLLSIAVNIGVLAYFKYFNFFADSFVELVNGIGFEVSRTTLDITLPVGISFYTFQTLSYSLDIYRRVLTPTSSLVNFACFVAFFPQLVAGPIVRAKEFLFQLEKRRRLTPEKFQSGLLRFLQGYFKKIFIADSLGILLVDPVFANPSAYDSPTLWFALLGYTVQIYADFSGYSSMAIGSALLLGFEIPENFAFPYLARNMSEFWQRWHMTMSRFFRDYVYIPLGGNRGSRFTTIRNLAATTFVSGLWHGAAWTFVAWGLVHGVFIAVFQVFRASGRGFGSGFFGTLFSVTLTQACVIFAWLLFRASDFDTAWSYLLGLAGSLGTETITGSLRIYAAFGAFFLDHSFGYFAEKEESYLERFPVLLRAAVYVLMIVILYRSYTPDVNPFIYFAF